MNWYDATYELDESSDTPRLTGSLTYGVPCFWKMVATDDAVSLVPNEKGIRGLIWYLVVLALVVECIVIFIFPKYCDLSEIHGWWYLIGSGPSIAILIGVIGLGWGLRYAVRKGPLFHFSKSAKILVFPRLAREIRLEQAIRWDLIHGIYVRLPKNDIRAKSGGKRLFGEDISELHLVYREGSKVFSLPLVGEQGYARLLNSTGSKIAEMTGIPVYHIESGGGLFEDWF